MVWFTDMLRRLKSNAPAGGKDLKAEGGVAELLFELAGSESASNERRRPAGASRRERKTSAANGALDKPAAAVAEQKAATAESENDRGRRGRKGRRRRPRREREPRASEAAATEEAAECDRGAGEVAIVGDVERLDDLIGDFETTGRVSVRRRGKDRTRAQRADALSYFDGGVASEDPEAGAQPEEPPARSKEKSGSEDAETQAGESDVIWRKVSSLEGAAFEQTASNADKPEDAATGTEAHAAESDDARSRRRRRGGRRRRKSRADGAQAQQPLGVAEPPDENEEIASEGSAAPVTTSIEDEAEAALVVTEVTSTVEATVFDLAETDRSAEESDSDADRETGPEVVAATTAEDDFAAGLLDDAARRERDRLAELEARRRAELEREQQELRRHKAYVERLAREAAEREADLPEDDFAAGLLETPAERAAVDTPPSAFAAESDGSQTQASSTLEQPGDGARAESVAEIASQPLSSAAEPPPPSSDEAAAELTEERAEADDDAVAMPAKGKSRGRARTKSKPKSNGRRKKKTARGDAPKKQTKSKKKTEETEPDA